MKPIVTLTTKDDAYNFRVGASYEFATLEDLLANPPRPLRGWRLRWHHVKQRAAAVREWFGHYVLRRPRSYVVAVDHENGAITIGNRKP